MPTQIFLMPIIGTGSRTNPTRPKYSMLGSSQLRDGLAMITMVATSAENSVSFAEFDDVFAFPLDLDAEVSAEFEDDINDFMIDNNFGIPVRGDEGTYRVLMRRLAGWFQIAQRMQINGGYNLEAYDSGVTLDSVPFVESAAFLKSMQDLDINISEIETDQSFGAAFWQICNQFDDRRVAGMEDNVFGPH